jgi:hypothetical protein
MSEQIHASFAGNGIQPSYETMQAATWLAFQLNEPWSSFRRISKAAAKRFFLEIIQGRCVARFDDYGRVIVHKPLRARTRAID